MCTEIDVFISNYTLVDPEIYELWVNGYSGKEIECSYILKFTLILHKIMTVK